MLSAVNDEWRMGINGEWVNGELGSMANDVHHRVGLQRPMSEPSVGSYASRSAPRAQARAAMV
jgi:hypothetical protein